MRKSKVYIAAEDVLTRQIIQSVFENYFHEFEIIGQSDSAIEAQFAILQHQAEVVVVDLNLTGGDALQMLKILRPISFHTIFISSFNDYFIEALQFAQMDFVFKPFDVSDLISTIDKVSETLKSNTHFLPHHHQVETFIKNMSSTTKEIILKGNRSFTTQGIHQIVWAEAKSSTSVFHLADKTVFEANTPLRRYESMLQLRSFFRCHPYILVNLQHIDYIDPVTYCIHMTNGDKIPFEERRYQQLTFLLGEERKVIN